MGAALLPGQLEKLAWRHDVARAERAEIPKRLVARHEVASLAVDCRCQHKVILRMRCDTGDSRARPNDDHLPPEESDVGRPVCWGDPVCEEWLGERPLDLVEDGVG